MTRFPSPDAPWWVYLLCVLAAVSIIRLLLSALRWFQGRYSPWQVEYSFPHLLIGFKAGPKVDDYLLPAVVGLLELAVYPFLLAAGKPEYIGAWLGFKVVPQLGQWSSHRETYQRFLIGNALTLIASYCLQILFFAYPCHRYI